WPIDPLLRDGPLSRPPDDAQFRVWPYRGRYRCHWRDAQGRLSALGSELHQGHVCGRPTEPGARAREHYLACRVRCRRRIHLRRELALSFLLGMATVPILALHLIGASVVRAFGGIIAALAPERIVRDGFALAIVAAVFWGSLYRLDATLAMASTLLSSIAVLG